MNRVDAAVTWEGLYRMAVEVLSNNREARWMVEEASGEPFGRATGTVPDRARRRLEDMVRRRAEGEPLQYVLGSWSFRGLELMVDRRVLIPRPETEQVVDVALKELDAMPAADHGGHRKTVVDLGTGSGAIALAVAQERTRVDVWAVDASADALAVASANLAGLGGFAATRVRMVQGDWWSALPAELTGRVDLAVSNPPYISSREMAGLDPQVRDWEPLEALEAGPEGVEAIEAILRVAPEWLAPTGAIVVELAPDQAGRARDLAERSGLRAVRVEPDLSGRARVLVGRRSA